MAENKDNNITSVMEALIKGAETVFTTKTVVGEATKVDDTIMSGKMSPSAVLLIKNGQTRLVNIKNQDSVNKVLDMIPDIVDRFTAPKQEMMSDEEAVDAAFPEEKENKEA